MNENTIIKECESIPRGGNNLCFFEQDEKNAASVLPLHRDKSDLLKKGQQRLLTQNRDSININPASALEVAVNLTYQVSIPENNMLLVKVSTDNIKKITAVAQTDNDSKFETYLFTYDDTTQELTTIATSQNIFSTSDALSFLPEGGWYYVLIQVLNGDRTLYFRLQTSDKFSENEPNDSPYQVNKVYTDCMRLNDSFDNEYDVDCSLLNITDPSITMYITMLLSDKAVIGNLNFYIINMSEGYLEASTVLSVPTYGVSWKPTKAGLYCIYLKPTTTSLLNQDYSVLIAGENSTAFSPSLIHIQRIEDVVGSGKISNNWWVTGETMTLYGGIEGISESVPIRVQITGRDGITQRMIMSDPSTNYYGIEMLLPRSYGRDGTLSGYLGANSYDLQPIQFFDFLGKQIPCEAKYIYHILNK